MNDTTQPKSTVPKKLTRPHSLVDEFHAAARKADEDKGVLRINFERYLRVRTSRASLPRALLIVDTLIKQLEAQGLKVRIGTKHTETELVLREGVLSFRLDERTTRSDPPPLTARELREQAAGGYVWRPNYVMVGTGEFSLEFGRYLLKGLPHSWKDRPGRPLEDQISEVLFSLPAWEEALRLRNAEREAENARRKEEESRRHEVARNRETLRIQRARLVRSLEAWERAERLRKFIAACASSPKNSSLQVWMDWATEQADSLDPIQRDASSLTSLEVDLGPYFSAPSPWEKMPTDWWREANAESPEL